MKRLSLFLLLLSLAIASCKKEEMPNGIEVLPTEPSKPIVPTKPGETIDPSIPGYYKAGTYEGVGVEIDGLWWAPVNVGYPDDPYGLLFNWGKDVGFEYGAKGDYTTNVNWNDLDQGPCPDGWRLPTKAEYDNLLSPANSPAGTSDSDPGQWVFASKNNPNGLAGRWFGPNCKTATGTTTNNSVFFPASGHWDGSTSTFSKKKHSWLLLVQ